MKLTQAPIEWRIAINHTPLRWLMGILSIYKYAIRTEARATALRSL